MKKGFHVYELVWHFGDKHLKFREWCDTEQESEECIGKLSKISPLEVHFVVLPAFKCRGEVCSDCCFFATTEQGSSDPHKAGWCRRSPPGMKGGWPLVYGTNSCGEFRSIDAKPGKDDENSP